VALTLTRAQVLFELGFRQHRSQSGHFDECYHLGDDALYRRSPAELTAVTLVGRQSQSVSGTFASQSSLWQRFASHFFPLRPGD
jgi:hypothetical protein